MDKIHIDVAALRVREDGDERFLTSEEFPSQEIVIGGDASLGDNLRSVRKLWAQVEEALAKRGYV